MNFRCNCALALLALAGPVASSAQPSVAMFGYSLSMGSVSVGQEQLYRLSFRPDFPLGRVGIGLDLELFVERNGDLGSRGWEAGSSPKPLTRSCAKSTTCAMAAPTTQCMSKSARSTT